MRILRLLISLHVAKGELRLGVAVTSFQTQIAVTIAGKGRQLARFECDLSPALPLLEKVNLPRGVTETDLLISVLNNAGRELISNQPKLRAKSKVPPPATAPAAPEEIASADELFITGLHLDQYRHATRSPVLYWKEALRRDPLDARCNNALGLWHLKRGEFAEAETCFRKAIERLTRRNSNPYDGEAYYNLGLCLRHLERDAEAYGSFYKATWNQAWCAASYHALAEMDCSQKKWAAALEHLNRSLRFDTDNLRARNLKVMVLRELGNTGEANALLQSTLQLDPLDGWARHLGGEINGAGRHCDLQTRLDLAHDLARAGFAAMAVALLKLDSARDTDLPTQSLGALPLVQYTLGWLNAKGSATAKPR